MIAVNSAIFGNPSLRFQWRITVADQTNPVPEAERSATAQQVQQVVEPNGLEPLYANFARVSGLPEEMILDFGLNPQAAGGQPLPVKISQRLVVNYYTAKRLWLALGAFLQRHEQAFGEIQIDVNKRVIPQRPAK